MARTEAVTSTKREAITPAMKIVCQIENCGKRARSIKSGLCEMHYYRNRRTGTTGKLLRGTSWITTDGYRMLYVPDHPLAAFNKTNHVLEHRVVMYDAYGFGPYACHVCGKPVQWATMDIDHLDDYRLNNALSNLAEACPICNRMRGISKQIEGQRRSAPQYTYQGRTMCAAEWAIEIGITRQSFLWRVQKGWSEKAIFETPRGRFGPHA